MRIRVVDCISNILMANDIKHIYMVTGGAAMHLNDALGNQDSFEVHYLHHEQSCSIAAESNARHSYIPSVVNVTAGPGSINAINGVFGAHVDSIPMIIISGQAKTTTLVNSYKDDKLRQLGDQEVDICSAMRKMTKYIKQLRKPEDIKYELEKCIYLSMNGRPGPCWLDIPIDIQGTFVDEKELIGFENFYEKNHSLPNLNKNLPILLEKIKNSKRPLIYVGSGIRASDSCEKMINFAEQLSIPIVSSWNSNDLIWDDHQLFAGRPGTVGTRVGNYVVQTCDVLLVLGARLNIRQISYNWECFADQAWVCHIDIDESELNKPTLSQDLKINSDLRDFFNLIDLKKLKADLKPNETTRLKWINWINNLKDKYNFYYDQGNVANPKDKVNPYFFIHSLSKNLKEEDSIIFADGTACVAGFQSAIIKKGQRLYHNSGCASMGYELPAAIGAYHATKKKIFCIAGDGSIMMNIQDLATISSGSLPIIIFILENEGYHSIRQTQENFFPGRSVGCGSDSGLNFPDFKSLGEGFKIETIEVNKNEELKLAIDKSLKATRPLIVILKLDKTIPFTPKVTSKKLEDGSMVTARLEDMSPFLPKEIHEEILKSANEIQ